MEIRLQESSMERIAQYINLYSVCFPHAKHLNMEYLTWLYVDNPCGQAIGIDALSGERVVGHNILVPTQFILDGQVAKGLVSMNTVVHPDFQGRQLFKKLGLQMCDYAAGLGYSFIIGVANAASTPGFVKHMGFQLVSPLSTKIGIGSFGVVDYVKIQQSTQFKHLWNSDTLSWRARNPANLVYFDIKSQVLTAYTSAGKFGFSGVAELFLDEDYVPELTVGKLRALMPRVFLGLIPDHKFGINYIDIPEKLKPSPLNFIFKSLINEEIKLDKERCSINFLDFDAF
jgi:hypothetical protein